MRPYYQHSGITIYHGDCREIVPQLGKFDLVLTDPPYGVQLGTKRNNLKLSFKREKYSMFDDTPEFIQTVVIPAIKTCIEKFGRVVVTPGNRCMWLYPAPDEIGCIFNPAGNGLCRWGFNMSHPILFYGKDPKMPNAYANGLESTAISERNGHPCPKPLKWMTWLITRCSLDGETILDPFGGSGTTCRAAKDLGRKCTMIELEEKYCEIAANRMAQEVMNIF